MKKETVYIRQKVTIKYDTDQDRKGAIQSLKKYPNSKSIGCFGWSWEKVDSPIQIIIQKRTTIK